MTAGVRIARKHEMFIRELTAASAAVTLESAAPQWQLAHFDRADGKGNCQLCHTAIINVVVIKNPSRGMYLRIGHDCYDKLIDYQQSLDLGAITYVDRKKEIGRIKSYVKRHIDAAVLRWLEGRKRLPSALRRALMLIKAVGYAPQLSDAEGLVEYYKNHRKFSLYDLLSPEQRKILEVYPERGSLPKTLTLAVLPAVQEALATWHEAEQERLHQEREQKRQTLLRFAQCGLTPSNLRFEAVGQSMMLAFEYGGVTLHPRIDSSDAYYTLRSLSEEDLRATRPATLELTAKEMGDSITFHLGYECTKTWVENVRKIREEREAARERERGERIERLLDALVDKEVDLSGAEIISEGKGDSYSITLRFPVGQDTVISLLVSRHPGISGFRLGLPGIRSDFLWSGACRNLLEKTMPPCAYFAVNEETGEVILNEESAESWLAKAYAESKLRNARLEEQKQARLELEKAEWEQAKPIALAKAKQHMEGKVAEDPDMYLETSFRWGKHPRTGENQRETRVRGVKYVLAREDHYDPNEGTIYVRVVRELVPERVMLVTRIYWRSNPKEKRYELYYINRQGRSSRNIYI